MHYNTYHVWYFIKKHLVPMFSVLRVLVRKLPCGPTSSWKIKIKINKVLGKTWQNYEYSNMWVYLSIGRTWKNMEEHGRTWKNTRTHVPPGTCPASDATMTHGKNHDQSLMYLLLQCQMLVFEITLCLLVASTIGSYVIHPTNLFKVWMRRTHRKETWFYPALYAFSSDFWFLNSRQPNCIIV